MVHPYLSAFISNAEETYPSSGLIIAQLGVVEPKSNLLGSSIEGVGSVDQVSAALSAYGVGVAKIGGIEE